MIGLAFLAAIVRLTSITRGTENAAAMNGSQFAGLAVGTVAVSFLFFAEWTRGNVVFFAFVLLFRDGHYTTAAAVVVGCENQRLVRRVDVGIKLSPEMALSTTTATQ